MISEFPLFMFTTLGGLAAGAYIASAVFPLSKDSKRPWLFPLICLVLLAVGMVFLPLHLGRPERMLFALGHPGAMITQESYWSAAFGIIVLADIIVAKVKGASPRALHIVGAVAALGLVFVMANAYFVSTGVPAWCTWQTFLLYFFGDLAMGFALLAVFENGLFDNKAYWGAALAFDVLAIIAFVLEIGHFASVGSDFALFIVAAIVAAAGAAAFLLLRNGKMGKKNIAWIVFACMFVAVAVARYGFYAACVL